MHSGKRLRLVAAAGLFTLLLFVLYQANSGLHLRSVTSDSKAAKLVVSSNILNSQNDEKKDELINNEIGKLSGGKDDDSDAAELEAQINAIGDADEGKGVEVVAFDPAKELLEIRMISPMVVFSKTYCPFSKKIKKLLLDNYEFNPDYAVVELDKHEHGAELQEYLLEVTGRRTVPNVLVGQLMESRGGCDDFVSMHEQGQLIKTLNQWGSGQLVVNKKDTPSNF